MAGTAQAYRPGRHASGGPSGCRHNLRDWPIRRNPVGRVLPIMWNHGTGAEVMQRIAVPMIGGMVSATILTLVVIPAVYAIVKGATIRSWGLVRPGYGEHSKQDALT